MNTKPRDLRQAAFTEASFTAMIEPLGIAVDDFVEPGLGPSRAALTARLTEVATLPNGWKVYGKTGTGAATKDDGSEDWEHSIGWFVG